MINNNISTWFRIDLYTMGWWAINKPSVGRLGNGNEQSILKIGVSPSETPIKQQTSHLPPDARRANVRLKFTNSLSEIISRLQSSETGADNMAADIKGADEALPFVTPPTDAARNNMMQNRSLSLAYGILSGSIM